MRGNSFRKFGSGFLASAVWFGAVALPVGIFAQTTTDAGNTQDNTKKDKKDKNKKEQAKTETQTASTGKLPVNEDPAMIGKRDINGSASNKFFGWLGGSREKEAAIGRQMAMEVEQQSKILDDPVVTEYINRVGQNLVLHSDAKVPFTIKVIQDDSVNAFALPGGYFFVNTGLILAADNEAELAGAMAHEIGHVAARHAMENQGKSAFINYAAIAGMIFGGPIVSDVLYNGGGVLAGLASLKFSRSAEEEADRLGVQYLYAAGYDPLAMSTMFEKLEAMNKKKPGSMAKLFATHPQPVDRREKSLALVSRFPEHEEYVVSTSEFQRVKARLMKMTNARATTAIDIDDSTPNGKPTLKRRAPEIDDTTVSPSNTDSNSSDGPPQLKRRDGIEPSTTTPTTTTSPATTNTTTTAPPPPSDSAPKLKRRDGGTTPTPSPSPLN
ncbi:MAG: M48 family metallopeptidase [Pyrinomonadaceae bacterium]